MTGVRITQNVDSDIKKKLGFPVLAGLSFMLGVPYPLPDWYPQLSDFNKKVWMVYCSFGDLMILLLFISNVVKVLTSYRDIRPFVTCTGTITYIICFRIKLYLYKKKTNVLEKVIHTLHKITENLNNNPIHDKGYFTIYLNHFKHMIFFGRGKIGAIAGGVFTLAIFEMSHGYFQDSSDKRNLPMFGWFPYDSNELLNFQFTCVFQTVSYLAFLLKDVVVDLLFLAILVTLNTHLIYLRKLLDLTAQLNEEQGTRSFTLADKKKFICWWVENHQMVLRTIEDFKEITNPYLFSKYISVGIILFLGGVLVTSDTEYDLVQQMIVLAINSSNLFQLYVFSVMGDEITHNGLKMTENGLHTDVILGETSIRSSYLFMITRSCKSILIHFGKINPLCVASFAQIVKVTFSYFLTIIQIRDKALGNDNLQTLSVNSSSLREADSLN